jgi:hypothetical protein
MFGLFHHCNSPHQCATGRPRHAKVAAVVPVEEVERYAREYISLFALAKQQGRHFLAVKKELDAAGVTPVFNSDQIGATFYRRSDC